jgi:hypothetical protein
MANVFVTILRNNFTVLLKDAATSTTQSQSNANYTLKSIFRLVRFNIHFCLRLDLPSCLSSESSRAHVACQFRVFSTSSTYTLG